MPLLHNLILGSIASPLIFHVLNDTQILNAQVSNYSNSNRFSHQKSTSISKGSSCASISNSVKKVIGRDQGKWSLTIIDRNSNVLADVNGSTPRIPASNLKLLSTAFALEKLGPNFLLSTSLYKRKGDQYEILGEGDPDLNEEKLKRIVDSLKVNLPKTPYFKSNPTLTIREEPSDHWWPNGWKTTDKNESYGAPITRLAIHSNTSSESLKDPTGVIKLTISSLSDIKQKGIIFKTSPFKKLIESRFSNQLLHREYSAPMIALLSLSNAESHNFTAEVLLRNASRTWVPKKAAQQLLRWLKDKKIPTQNIRIYDGSGLSRNNLLTTRSLTSILYYMSTRPNFPYYISSLAVAGQRGTLADFTSNTSINGRFYGKTGTLDGVRSLSGYMESPNGYLYLSIISNGAMEADLKLPLIIEKIYQYSLCNFTHKETL